MSDSEAPAPPTPKPTKKKREMTPEQLAKLRENLKKGRETALRNRQKRAMEKKIDAEAAEKARDEKIAKAMLGEKPHKEEITELKDEIKRLKSEGGNKDEIKELRSQMAAMVEIIKAVAVKKKQEEETPIKKHLTMEDAPAPAPPTPLPPAQPAVTVEVKEEVKPAPKPEPVKKVADVSKRNRRDALNAIGFF
jgi:hypothetical protein